MKHLRSKRKLAGVSQIMLANRAGVSKMRIQLAESGQVTLRVEEISAIDKVLQNAIQRRASALATALMSGNPTVLPIELAIADATSSSKQDAILVKAGGQKNEESDE